MSLIESETLLETPRLLLEPIQSSHAPALYELLQSPALYEYIPEQPPISVEVLAARYQQFSIRQSPDGQEMWLNWAMCLREDTSSYIGVLQATIYPDMTAFIAYILFPAFWKQGYAREGCMRILDLLFTDYQVNKVSAEIDTRNLASINLVESLNFQRVATTFDADFFKGETSHEYRYEQLSPLSQIAP